MNKKNIVSVVILVVVAGLAFYGGMNYGGNNVRAAMMSRGQFGAGARTRGVAGGGFVGGQIIAKDTNSITVQLTTGGPGATGTQTAGSKIIFLDTNTKVSKQATGTLNDLAVGTEVIVTGTPNTDGSINATAVQIRPQTMVK